MNRLWMLSVPMIVLGTEVASGQNFPNKPIRFVTFQAGGGGDLSARFLAQGISGPLGQPVIVDNRGGLIPIEVVAKAPPDGYTLLVGGQSMLIAPLLQKVNYDPERDFSPVIMTGSSPNVLCVHPSLPVKSVKELIALAKARPGQLNYASGSTGQSTHLAGELFRSMAGVNIVRVPYTGGGPAVIALLTGEVQLMFSAVGSSSAHVKSGKLRALAVTSAAPSVLVPELPTVAASGLPGYEYIGFDAIFAPAKTPVAIINQLNQETVRFLKTTGVKEKLLSFGVEVVGNSPEQFAVVVKSEIAKWGKLIKDAGIRAE